MREGLLPASCIPPVEPRDGRALTRSRTQLVQERRREVNRLQGGREDAILRREDLQDLVIVAHDFSGLHLRHLEPRGP